MKDLWKSFNDDHKTGVILCGIGMLMGIIIALGESNTGEFSVAAWIIGIGMGWFCCAIRSDKNAKEDANKDASSDAK